MMLRQIFKHITFIEAFTVAVLIATPFWLHFQMFPGEDKLSRVMDWLSISGVVIGLAAYVIALSRNIRRAVADEEE
ncbi:hypothetical protein [Neorhizobium alkalisoli]|jgi:type VI protein secretion system component VasK|uniref:Uncharacterized protein n=1 Tax=Neorhizobium alkalisoli TaxID=528178 RepID=A0A561PSX0_9HYPH|nr:hypothetical protein [Neorhizobium alkalisoli]TWF41183.1 hypothetical protein FHW37_1272 [Neorhizobium alkalisoli]